MIKKLFSLLLPKEDKFFRLIEQLSVQAEASAVSLKTCVEAADQPARAAAAKKAADSRTEAKRLSTEVTKQLCLTFITPFDREDIEAFSLFFIKSPKSFIKSATACNITTCRARKTISPARPT